MLEVWEKPPKVATECWSFSGTEAVRWEERGADLEWERGWDWLGDEASPHGDHSLGCSGARGKEVYGLERARQVLEKRGREGLFLEPPVHLCMAPEESAPRDLAPLPHSPPHPAA